jgi:hypothetical protein
MKKRQYSFFIDNRLRKNDFSVVLCWMADETRLLSYNHIEEKKFAKGLNKWYGYCLASDEVDG